MSEFATPVGWEEIDFYDIRKDDQIIILTRVEKDAPSRDDWGIPVIRVEVDETDTIYRRKLKLAEHTFKPGTLVKVTWQAGNFWTYRVTKKGNFREVKSGIKIRKENYPFVQRVEVVEDDD
jgi:hypothetical protein